MSSTEENKASSEWADTASSGNSLPTQISSAASPSLPPPSSTFSLHPPLTSSRIS